ncbi:glycosyltransferase family 4 protein [Sandarakinorhabdus sp. DWP1-3-1]|uniref:glycosyltransferase family 4 protein n=1 Tax=Sandarakinorhabdus sp. DWP1-3-1 TaxID=2804627 RepID=UPI003CEFB7F1
MKIVVLASLAWSLTNFRGTLLAAMVRAGHEVVACAPDDNAETRAALEEIGVRFRRIPMSRVGLNPFADALTVAALVRLLRAERPDTLLAYTQKPIIYGGIAARLVGGIRFHAMVSGLGHVFTDDGQPRRLLRRLVAALYRAGVRDAETVFVFNRDDPAEMARWGILRPDHVVVQVPGSGVDTRRFAAEPIPPGAPVFLLVARLLRNKGLGEFAAAARRIRARHPDARFQLLGPHDANPASIARAELDDWVGRGDIEYLGETRDVRPYLAAASVFVLPTWYREGLPRTILEALATGRPVITTDAPGCRETIDGNGYLVPVRDAGALEQAMQAFVDDPWLAVRMGRRSRELAEQRFDTAHVNAMLLAGMGLDRPAVTVRSVARFAMGAA